MNEYDSWKPISMNNQPGHSSESGFMATLNDGQLAAIKTAGRHVLVRAGAGTGKTTTIVGRCSYLIESGVDPSSIQILTFTRRAAREVQHRVEEQLGEGAYGLNSSTFHAWCMSLIRGNEKVWGYEAWTIIDGDDQELLFRGIRGNQERGFPNARQIASAYSFSRNSGVGFLKIVRDRFQVDEQTATQRLVPIARSYESKKRENRYLDYDDILVIVGAQRLPSGSESGFHIYLLTRCRIRILFSGTFSFLWFRMHHSIVSGMTRSRSMALGVRVLRTFTTSKKSYQTQKY